MDFVILPWIGSEGIKHIDSLLAVRAASTLTLCFIMVELAGKRIFFLLLAQHNIYVVH